MKQIELDRRLLATSKNIQDFVEDRLHRWTEELSNLKSGSDAIMNSRKRDLTRNLFYNKVGAGGLLAEATVDEGFYVNSINQSQHKKVQDHIMPPQLLGEFFLDKLCGYHTEKDETILTTEKLTEYIKSCFKVITIPDKTSTRASDGKYKSLNHLLSYHSCYSDKAINNPNSYMPIVVSQKYKYLNECDVGVKNGKLLIGNLTIMRDGRNATDEEISWLFKSLDGFDEWQQEKYNAKGVGFTEFVTTKFMRKQVGSLEDFFQDAA